LEGSSWKFAGNKIGNWKNPIGKNAKGKETIDKKIVGSCKAVV
jgi:hypothetical protein